MGGRTPIALWVRLPMAVALVAWGARTDRRWTVPRGMDVLALPALWFGSLSMLLAVVAVRRMSSSAGRAIRSYAWATNRAVAKIIPEAPAVRTRTRSTIELAPPLPSSPT